MPGPTTPTEAVAWVLDALENGRYFTTRHFDQRCSERKFTVFDAKRVARTAMSCEAYADAPVRAGGTAWRIRGTATDGSAAAIGVEAFKDHLGRRVLLITVMDG